jgi:hypothetical protein
MTYSEWPTTESLREVFDDQLRALGGRVTDTFHDADASRLFVRAILPGEQEVRPRDRLQGGVAMRATDQDICVHPYVYRVVCRNGAIRAHAVQTVQIRRDNADLVLDSDVIGCVRDAVRCCCAPEAFEHGLNEMRGTLEQQADTMLSLLPMLRMLPASIRERLLAQCFDSLHSDAGRRRGDERTRFGLMQAITATAREQNDPETRWRLEELGGGVPVMTAASPSPRPLAAELALSVAR